MMEEPMCQFDHPHASFDRFPQLVHDLEIEFGPDGLDTVVERFVGAELGEFVWDGRIAERDLGAYESFDDDEFEGSDLVRILSFSAPDIASRPALSTAPGGFR
ncbi:hypothetical protein [Inquilinus sp. OTU3971]|uniref:hypothetical protein n=1 Tax=Inquilinus sp. OTU3971 TaxID=3043855 RepID=UPI00313DF420